MAKVKCADCGYLALRGNLSRQLVEVDEACRIHGLNPAPDGVNLYCGSPICAVMAFDLAKEDSDSTAEDWLEIFDRERPCEKFVAWSRGLTPKEHIEMMQERARLEWQSQREDADRAWRAAQEDRAERRHKENLRTTIWTALAAAIIGVVGTLATVAISK